MGIYPREQEGQQSQQEHNRRIDTGHAADEQLGGRLPLRGFFHQRQDAGEGALLENRRYPDADGAVGYNHPGQDLTAANYLARNAFAGERGCIEPGKLIFQRSVQGNAASGGNFNRLAHGHLVRCHLFRSLCPTDPDTRGADVE